LHRNAPLPRDEIQKNKQAKATAVKSNQIKLNQRTISSSLPAAVVVILSRLPSP
jgi:hypothetical protein